MFELWKTLDNSRSNAFNYENIIGLLAEDGLAEEVVSVLGDMKSSEICPSSEIYYLVIRCFTQKGRFDDALFYLKEMVEMNLKPTTEIYDGLIQAYANHKMYDEMDQCVKKMETTGCLPDHITYNLLIREFSRAGLLKRMERTYQTLLSKRMSLESSTMLAMLEAYANFGMMENMEMVYIRVMNSKKTHLKDDLIRKLAGVYIENHMFSRLDDLGNDISKRTGRTDMVWCLRILSHACLLSRKGMDSIVRQMEYERAPWNVTVANIMLLACLKMKDLKHLKYILSELPAQCVKPDIVTFGILFDASRLGLDMSKDLNTWRRMGLLNEAVEINTDPLVLTAFGKGHFLQACENAYSSLKSNSRKNQVRTYRHLINMVIEHNKQLYTESKSTYVETKVPAMEGSPDPNLR